MAVKTPTPAEKRWAETVAQEQRRTYAEFVRTAHQLRRMRALRLSGRAPRAFQSLIGRGVRVPMSWSLVQTVVGMIVKNQPTFRRIPRGPKDRDSAAMLARSAWPLIETYSRIAKKPLYYLMADSLAGDGRAVVKLSRKPIEGYPQREAGQTDKAYNKSVEDFLSEEGRRTVPLRVSLVDPTTFWPSREEFESSYVVESGRRPLIATMRNLGLKYGVNKKLEPVSFDPVGRTMTEWEVPAGAGMTTTVDAVWTDNEAFISIGGEWLKFDNEFGFIPFGWRFGQVTSINDPMLESSSIIFPFAGVEPWLNTLMSVLLAWSILGGTPILAVHTQPNANLPPGSETAPADIPLGKMINPGVGKQLQFIQPPPVGREVIEAIQLLMSIYEKAGITSMARGIIGTRTAGSAFGGALEAAGDMFAPIVGGLQGILEDTVSMTYRAVDRLGTPMWVTGYSLEEGNGRKALSPYKIDPKDIDGYHDIHCQLKLSNMQDLISRGMHAAFMKGHKLWSWDHASEFSGSDDPPVERLEILKDDIRGSPLYQEQALRAALQDDPAMAQVVQAADAAGMPLVQLMQQGRAGLQAQMAEAEDQAASGGGGRRSGGGKDRTVYKGGQQPRGGPSPQGGGREQGSPRRPTGPRKGTPQGQQFP
jgi:hypothetical protein